MNICYQNNFQNNLLFSLNYDIINIGMALNSIFNLNFIIKIRFAEVIVLDRGHFNIY